jgi:hypothetical protein
MLDEYLIKEKDQVQFIKLWWRKKRVLYNFIILFWGLVILFSAYKAFSYIRYGFMRYLPDVFYIGLWANLFFTFFYVLELLIYKKFRKYYSYDFGITIFWLYTFISVLGMLMIELEILRRVNYFLPS